MSRGTKSIVVLVLVVIVFLFGSLIVDIIRSEMPVRETVDVPVDGKLLEWTVVTNTHDECVFTTRDERFVLTQGIEQYTPMGWIRCTADSYVVHLEMLVDEHTTLGGVAVLLSVLLISVVGAIWIAS